MLKKCQLCKNQENSQENSENHKNAQKITKKQQKPQKIENWWWNIQNLKLIFPLSLGRSSTC